MDQFKKRLMEIWAKTRPFREEAARVWKKTKSALYLAGSWAYKLRTVLLAAPVALAAVILALRNAIKLPREVGINLLASGDYALIVHRSLAVLGPLAITVVCLLLMFCSRRVAYPWLISLFSLILPILILITNVFPG